MDIRPTPIIASLAGTARAQAKGSEAPQGTAGGGAAQSRELNKSSEVEAGSKSEDRDADGRQLLHDGGSGDHGDEHAPEGDQAADASGANPPHPSPAIESRGTHIDFDA